MRIGTWNLAGRWSPGNRRLLEDAGCDVWLLTEVPAPFSWATVLVRSQDMPRTRARSWAAVWSAGSLAAVAPAHPAAAIASRDGTLLCSCVLPWRGAARTWPDDAADTAGRTSATLARLRPVLVDASDGAPMGAPSAITMPWSSPCPRCPGRLDRRDQATTAGSRKNSIP